MDDVDLGWKFWGSLIGIVVGLGIAALLFFLLIGGAWYSWGALGALIFFGAILLGAAYIHDRRQVNKYEDLT